MADANTPSMRRDWMIAAACVVALVVVGVTMLAIDSRTAAPQEFAAVIDGRIYTENLDDEDGMETPIEGASVLIAGRAHAFSGPDGTFQVTVQLPAPCERVTAVVDASGFGQLFVQGFIVRAGEGNQPLEMALHRAPTFVEFPDDSHAFIDGNPAPC